MIEKPSLSDEELAKIATSSDEPVDMGQLTPVLRFIRDCQVKEGDVRVVTYIIYWYYLNKWFPEKMRRLARSTFFVNFKKYFGHRYGRTGTHKYYLLDEYPFNQLTKRERKLARRYGRRINRGTHKRKKKEKNQPQQS